METSRFVLRWDREDRHRPGLVGTEILTLDLDDVAPGTVYRLPGSNVHAEYGMATPSLGQGAKAVALTGRVRVEAVTAEEYLLEVNLAAQMARIDLESTFTETLSGHFRVPKGGTEGP